MFPGETFPQVKSPLDKNDHPELDSSEIANEGLITKFMCMIGQLQWAVTLGRYELIEFVAAKTATEQIVDLRQTLRYLGVPIKSKANMFGDNKSVLTS